MYLHKTRYAVVGLLISLLFVATSVEAQVIVPPEPGDQLSVTITATVAFDGGTGLYTYSYEVANDSGSAQEMWLLALEITGESINRSSPVGWTDAVIDDRPIITWAATDIGALPPGYVDDGNVIPSPFQIKPGESLAGFSFQSSVPPGPVPFFAQGFTQLPQVTVDVGELPQEGEELLDFTENSFTATTTGPVSFVPVTIDVKPGSSPNSINPRNSGEIPVAVLTTASFDATSVDPLSVTFGPDGAIEAHGQGHIEDADDDGDLDLVLHFNTQDTGIECGDTAATLSGLTFGGQSVQGTDAINTVGCGIN